LKGGDRLRINDISKEAFCRNHFSAVNGGMGHNRKAQSRGRAISLLLFPARPPRAIFGLRVACLPRMISAASGAESCEAAPKKLRIFCNLGEDCQTRRSEAAKAVW
jgi:hypothetical protein